MLHISFNVSYQDHRVLFLKLKKEIFYTKKIKWLNRQQRQGKKPENLNEIGIKEVNIVHCI